MLELQLGVGPAPRARPAGPSLRERKGKPSGDRNALRHGDQRSLWRAVRRVLDDLRELVGTARFELATPCTPCKCATRLRYVPTI